MSTLFIVDGQEKTLEMRDENHIDWSGDFIGNNAHGMESDEEGRYIADQAEFDWWKKMIESYQEMESVVTEYKKNFGEEEVQEAVYDAIAGYDLEDQPKNVIGALQNIFGDAK